MYVHLLKALMILTYYLLNELNVSFDILAITDSHIKKDSSSSKNLQLDSISIEHTPTEMSTGWTLLYISKILSYQLRSDLKIYHPGKTESTL